MRASSPHWSAWPTALVAAALVCGGLLLERHQTPATPPPIKRSLDVTARARADFVVRIPDKARPASTDGVPASGFHWLDRTVDVRVHKGRVLVAAGVPMTPFRRRLLEAAWAAGPPPSLGSFVVRLVLILGLFVLVVWLGSPAAGSGRRLALLCLVTGASVSVGLLIKVYTDQPMACAPFAFGALVVALVCGRRAAVLVALATAGLALVADAAPAPALVGVAVGCVAAALLTLHRRTLSLVPAAALAGGLQAGILLVVAPVVPPFGGEVEAGLVVGAVGPWAAGLAGLVLAWPLLAWAQVSSAGRLRRLVAPRHPLMRELRRRAPGTYRHARNVAHLAEAGGRAIGGDLHLLRAGAWYHDLGKLLGAEVFAENFGPGEDPQRELSPGESARRIARHVGDGLRLARRYRLGPELRRLIAEHHGTSSIQGPLQRARREGRDIDPAVYYYPGPLPSSRVAAILMVSDAVEAASRRIDDPSLAAVSEVVEEVVDRLMSEYQFEDCDLTQVELVALAGAMVMTLRHRLHRRVEPAQAAPLTEPTSEVGQESP